MSTAASFQSEYSMACDSYKKLRDYHQKLFDAVNARIKKYCAPPYTNSDGASIYMPDVSGVCGSASDNLSQACTQIFDLWQSLRAYDEYIGLSMKCLYDRIGAAYPNDAKKVDGSIATVSCSMPPALESIQCASWDEIVSYTTSAIQYIDAKCGEMSLRAANFIKIYPKHIIITRKDKKGFFNSGISLLVIGVVSFFGLSYYAYTSTHRPGGYVVIQTHMLPHSVLIGFGFVLLFIVIGGALLGVYYSYKEIGSCGSTPAPPASTPTVHHRTDTSDKYTLFKDWSGSTLSRMDPTSSDAEWSFSPGTQVDGGFTADNEPTHGSVIYGQQSDLVAVVNNQLILSVSTDIVGGKRRSVRIHANDLYDSGVFIMDVAKVPSDPTTWPSFWLRGDTTLSSDATWACYGEVDIIEGVNGSSKNQCTLHTSTLASGSTCVQTAVVDAKGAAISPLISGDCGGGGDPSSNTCGCNKNTICPTNGCGYNMADGSFGTALNDKGGGVFACEVSTGGQVSFWFWPRDDALLPNIQTEINSGTIQTGSWATTDPTNTIHLSACPGHFQRLAVLINTTLCGDWAGNVYQDAADPTITGMAACTGAVADSAFTYNNGKWIINSVKIFQ